MAHFGLLKTPAEISEELAERLRLLRKDAKYTQAELAERSGVSLGSLKRFENTGKISLEALLKLAKVLHREEDFDVIFSTNSELKDIENLFSSTLRS